jgi:hypothetical protein
MNYETNRRTARTYRYRVDLDDRKALRKINVLDSLNSDYWIGKIHKSNVPTAGSGRHWGYIFYESKEHFDHERNEMVGGTIPGLHKYRYSLDWVPFPNDSLLEMRNANGGGTRIKGERRVGFSDPRLSDYVPIDTAVPWTPTEIEAMFDGEPVPDKMNYTYDHPEIEADEARELLREELRTAERIGVEEVYAALEEYVDNCDHDHVIETGDRQIAGWCEDCGRDWEQPEFEYDQENGNLQVVGTDA